MQVYAQSGAWNQLDPIFSQLTTNEFLVQYAAWIMLKSPIKLLTPLENLDQNKIRCLMNEQLLAIGQDEMKKQGTLIRHEEYQQGWQ